MFDASTSSWLSGRADGVRLAVKVTPRAAQSAVQGIEVDSRGQAYLAVRVAAAPDSGKANAALIRLLAKRWRLPASTVRLVAGATRAPQDPPRRRRAGAPLGRARGARAAAPSAGRGAAMSGARIIDGKAAAAELRAAIKDEAAAFQARHGVPPGLRVLLVGAHPASQAYVRTKARMAQEVGVDGQLITLPEDTGEAALLARIAALNRDPAVHGILVQLPLPEQIAASRVLDAIDPREGRRRLSPAQRRPAVLGERRARPGAAGAVHPDGLPDPPAAHAGRGPGRPPGAGDRPLQHRRQAAGGAAARRQLHGDDRPFPDPRSARRVPPRRDPGRRGGPGRRWCAAPGSAPGPR